MPPTKSTRSKTAAFLRNFIAAFCLILVMAGSRILETASQTTASTVSPNETTKIAPDSSLHRELPAQAKEVFEIQVDEPKLLNFSVDKGDLTLSITLYGPGGDKLLEEISEDFETVEVSFPLPVAGTYRIELQSREKVEKRPYVLKVQPLRTVTKSDRRDVDARLALANGDVLRADWTKNSLGLAVAKYENAARIWKSAGELSNASRANLRAGDVYFLLSRYNEARQQYQDGLNLAEQKRDWLVQVTALSRLARLYSYLGDNTLAQQELVKALDLCKRSELNSAAARNAYGEALSALGEVTEAKGNLKKASTHFQEALKFLEGDRKGEARIHLFAGRIAGSLGSTNEALAEVSQARDLSRATNDKLGEGLALTALGLFHTLTDKNRAIELHRAASEIFRTIGDRHSEAITFNALGQAYENLKDYPIALNNYESALRLFEAIGGLDGSSFTNCNVARAHYLNKDSSQALSYYGRCLNLSRSAGKVRTVVYALNEIARVYADQGHPELSLKQYQQIRTFCADIGDQRGLAKALNSEGDSLLRLGQQQRALDTYRQALPFSEKTGDPDILANTLYNVAFAELKLGFPEAALPFVQRSLKIIEDLRSNVGSPALRASFSSGVQKHYELCIAILMRLEQLRPGQGYAAAALVTSEKSRARLLIDFVSESRTALRHGAAKELLDRERELDASFRSLARYQMDLSLSPKDSAERAEVDNQLAQLRAEYQELQIQIRRQTPALSSLEQSESLDLQKIQSQLRDSDTMLLEYSLGDEHSYVWAVTSNSLSSYELPPRQVLEDSAREFYKSLTARQEVDGPISNDYPSNIESADKLYFEQASHLSQMLLGPLSEQLGTRRLILVREGALQYIPFEALPVPLAQSTGPAGNATSRKLLLESNEIVAEPSMSALIAVRRPQKRTNSTRKLVAIIADPVFSRSDERIQGEALGPSTASAPTDKTIPSKTDILTRDGSLARLVHASEEADAIASVAPWGTTMVAKGFDASRETAMSSNVTQYQIVHFATHGFLDSDHPELSGILLNSVDRNGVSANGMMPLNEIYSLDLSAELTVLSACQTALGKDIKGEGLVGLTHSFMSAGSKSVVASLWKIDDRATAVLMADFYQSMLQRGMSPAAALRSAKLKMLRDTRWKEPYFWAGFVLQGEYDNHIETGRGYWVPTGLVLFLLTIIGSGLLMIQKRKRDKLQNVSEAPAGT